jgi:hypothetical protein
VNRQSADPHPSPANLSAAGFTSKREKFFVVCPTDEILRSFLSGTTDTATANETVLHIVHCVSCRDRVASWNETPRLEQILRAFPGGSDVGPGPLGDDLVAADEEMKVLRWSSQDGYLRSVLLSLSIIALLSWILYWQIRTAAWGPAGKQHSPPEVNFPQPQARIPLISFRALLHRTMCYRTNP